MRIAYLLGYGLGFAVQTIAGRPTQNDRLRAENRSLQFEVIRLSRIADQLAATLYEKAVDEERAEQMVAHPAQGTPLTADEVEVLAVDFALCYDLGDVLWVMGGDVE